MKTAKDWAAKIEGDRTTPWAELVKMIQDDAMSVSGLTGGVAQPVTTIDAVVNCPPWCDTCQTFHRHGELRTCKEKA